MKPLIENKRAFFDYQILETFEAGMVLTGAEVKSVKSGRISLNDSFVRADKGEAFLFNAHIAPYEASPIKGYDPRRNRKLLLKKREIAYLEGKVRSGLTIIPLKVYIGRGFLKVQVAIARSKKKYDKREKLKETAIKREVERVLKERAR